MRQIRSAYVRSKDRIRNMSAASDTVRDAGLETPEDANLLAKWVLEHADEYGFDTAKIVAAGDLAEFF